MSEKHLDLSSLPLKTATSILANLAALEDSAFNKKILSLIAELDLNKKEVTTIALKANSQLFNQIITKHPELCIKSRLRNKFIDFYNRDLINRDCLKLFANNTPRPSNDNIGYSNKHSLLLHLIELNHKEKLTKDDNNFILHCMASIAVNSRQEYHENTLFLVNKLLSGLPEDSYNLALTIIYIYEDLATFREDTVHYKTLSKPFSKSGCTGSTLFTSLFPTIDMFNPNEKHVLTALLLLNRKHFLVTRVSFKDLSEEVANYTLQKLYELKLYCPATAISFLLKASSIKFNDGGFFAKTVIQTSNFSSKKNYDHINFNDDKTTIKTLTLLSTKGFLISKKSIGDLSKHFSFHEIAGMVKP